MAQLGVGHQLPVDEQRAADAGPEGEQQDHAIGVAAGAEAHLGQPGRVGVVEHDHRNLAVLRQQAIRVEALPRRVQVCRSQRDAAFEDAGQGDAHRTVPAELTGEGGDHLRHCHRGGGLRGEDADPLVVQRPAAQVDRAAFDAGPADVHAEPGRPGHPCPL